jgi:hypothetical protein
VVVYQLKLPIVSIRLQTPRKACDVCDHIILISDAIVSGSIATDEDAFRWMIHGCSAPR